MPPDADSGDQAALAPSAGGLTIAAGPARIAALAIPHRKPAIKITRRRLRVPTMFISQPFRKRHLARFVAHPQPRAGREAPDRGECGVQG